MRAYADAGRGNSGRRFNRRLQGFRQAAPHQDAERHDRGAEQHRRPPAPVLQLLGIEQLRERQTDEAGEEDCDVLRRVLHAEIESAAFRRCGFRHVGGGRADLAAQREPLQQPKQHHENRRGHADPGIGRRQRQADDRDAHQREGEQHRRLAADTVAHAADHDGAHRAGQESDAEGGKRGKQADRGVVRGEEGTPDVHREIGEGEKVVELQPVADENGDDVPEGNGFRRDRWIPSLGENGLRSDCNLCHADPIARQALTREAMVRIFRRHATGAVITGTHPI